MYPLNLTKRIGESVGFAVANDEAEHKLLSGHGYEPSIQKQPEAVAKQAETKPRARKQKGAE